MQTLRGGLYAVVKATLLGAFVNLERWFGTTLATRDQRCQRCLGRSWYMLPIPYAPCMVYLPTFGWFLGQMLVNIPYMEHLGIGSMVLLYMVLHGSHHYTPLMLAFFSQHHGSYMMLWVIKKNQLLDLFIDHFGLYLWLVFLWGAMSLIMIQRDPIVLFFNRKHRKRIAQEWSKMAMFTTWR